MITGVQALRLGWRAAARNPELSFAQVLLAQAGTALALLPLAVAALCAFGLAQTAPLRLLRLPLPLAGLALCAWALAWTVSVLFRALALPILAADVELGARPQGIDPVRLASNGFPRVAGAAAAGGLLVVLVQLCSLAGLAGAFVALAARASPARFALLALLGTASVAAWLAAELLARVAVVRAAVLGEGVLRSFAQAANLGLSRLPAFALVAGVFGAASVAVASVVGAVSAGLFAGTPALLALSPRLALAVAAAAPLAFLELGGLASVAALVADAEGLVAPISESPPASGETTLARLRPAAGPAVVEALPVDESEGPVVEALPAPPEPDEPGD